jgi:hypothetical protein
LQGKFVKYLEKDGEKKMKFIKPAKRKKSSKQQLQIALVDKA